MGRKKGCIAYNRGEHQPRIERARKRITWLLQKGYDLVTATRKAYWEFGIKN